MALLENLAIIHLASTFQVLLAITFFFYSTTSILSDLLTTSSLIVLLLCGLINICVFINEAIKEQPTRNPVRLLAAVIETAWLSLGIAYYFLHTQAPATLATIFKVLLSLSGASTLILTAILAVIGIVVLLPLLWNMVRPLDNEEATAIRFIGVPFLLEVLSFHLLLSALLIQMAFPTPWLTALMNNQQASLVMVYIAAGLLLYAFISLTIVLIKSPTLEEKFLIGGAGVLAFLFALAVCLAFFVPGGPVNLWKLSCLLLLPAAVLNICDGFMTSKMVEQEEVERQEEVQRLVYEEAAAQPHARRQDLTFKKAMTRLTTQKIDPPDSFQTLSKASEKNETAKDSDIENARKELQGQYDIAKGNNEKGKANALHFSLLVLAYKHPRDPQCPISLDEIDKINPEQRVVVASGHNFDRNSIRKCVHRKNENPVTRALFDDRDLVQIFGKEGPPRQAAPPVHAAPAASAAQGQRRAGNAQARDEVERLLERDGAAGQGPN